MEVSKNYPSNSDNKRSTSGLTEPGFINVPPTQDHLLWDFSSICSGLRQILRVKKLPKVNFAALANWMATRSPLEAEPTITIFVKLGQDSAAKTPRLNSGGHTGIHVKAENFDIAQDGIRGAISQHIVNSTHNARDLILATHDRELIRKCKQTKSLQTNLTVLGLSERLKGVDSSIAIVDLEEVEGLFAQPLVFHSICRLKPEGLLLPPLSPLH